MNNIYDTIIIGGGPIGLYAGFLSLNSNLKTLVLESQEQIGGQLSLLYPEKYIYNLPGINKILAKDFINNLLSQINNINNECIKLNSKVIEIDKIDNIFQIKTNNNTYYSKTIILSLGNGSFNPRLLGVENEESIANIHYYVNNFDAFKDKNIAIFGGGDSAIDWALHIKDIAKNVYLIHRRKDFRAIENNITKIKNSHIHIKVPYTLDNINNKDNHIHDITIMNKDTNIKENISIDNIICSFGFTSKIEHIENWKIHLKNDKIIVDMKQQSNIEGLFAIGDICIYEEKKKNLISGFSEAATSIQSIASIIYPDKNNKIY